MGFGGEIVWKSLINMKLTLHSQNLPGFKYFCPDFQNQLRVKFTGYDENIVFHSLYIIKCNQ